jgi:hypothetical protein
MRVLDVFFDDQSSLEQLQSQALDWMATFPNSMVLVILDGHSTVGSGELVYVLPGKKRVNMREMPANVSHDIHRSGQDYSDLFSFQVIRAAFGKSYDSVFSRNNGKRGLISLSCGHTYIKNRSRESWVSLVSR